MSLSDNELENLAQMESAASNRSAGGDLYTDIDYDGSQVKTFLFEEGYHPFELVDIEMFTSQKGDRGLKATQRCFAGSEEGKEIVDILMLSGKGAGKFSDYASAVGMWDAENKRPVGRYIDLIGRKAWANVKTEESEWQGQTRSKSVIPFGAYEPIDKYAMPDQAGMDFEDPFPVQEEVEPEPVKVAPKPAGRPRSGAAGSTPPWPNAGK